MSWGERIIVLSMTSAIRWSERSESEVKREKGGGARYGRCSKKLRLRNPRLGGKEGRAGSSGEQYKGGKAVGAKRVAKKRRFRRDFSCI